MKLEVRNIHKTFEGNEVLKGVSFSVQSGRALGLLGRNGAGKTTTIRIIMDIFHANSGEVLLDGKRFEASKNQVGYLPEERGMYPKKTVLEQMVYFAKLRGMEKRKAVESARTWLERLEVLEYEKRKMDTLSKGNQQKVQLAATLVCDPDIVVLDEPFSGLDPVNSQILKDVIRELIARGKLVIFSSHQMSYVEEFCEDIAIIDRGETILSGNLDEIKEEYGKGRKILAVQNMTVLELEKFCMEKLSDVLYVEGRNKHNIIFVMNDGVDQWKVLERIRRENIEIAHYGSYEPSLNDIFVSCVGGSDRG